VQLIEHIKPTETDTSDYAKYKVGRPTEAGKAEVQKPVVEVKFRDGKLLDWNIASTFHSITEKRTEFPLKMAKIQIAIDNHLRNQSGASTQ